MTLTRLQALPKVARQSTDEMPNKARHADPLPCRSRSQRTKINPNLNRRDAPDSRRVASDVLSKMEKLKRALELGVKGGTTAVLALLLSEGIFIAIALVAGVVGVMLSGWAVGGICVAATFILLNTLALPDTLVAVMDWISRRRSSAHGDHLDDRCRESASEQVENTDPPPPRS